MNWDRELFIWINSGWTSEWLDFVMPLISNLKYFVPLFVVVAAAIVWKSGRRGTMTLVALAILLVATDQLSSSVLKPAFHRPRPCRPEAALSPVVARARCSGRGSFPSSHAANMAAVAILLLLRHRRWGWFFVPAAGAVGLSRIYLGVHYPTDVAGGWALGAGLGGLAAWGAAGLDRLRFSARSAASAVDERDRTAYSQDVDGVGAQNPKAELPHGDGHGNDHARGAPDRNP